MTDIEMFLDQLRDRGGDLVNISSAAGRVATGGIRRLRAGINGWPEAPPDIRVTVIAPAAIATELAAHMTDPDSEKTAEDATAEIGIPAYDFADVIGLAISRPQRVTLNEILVRPTTQAMEANAGDARCNAQRDGCCLVRI